MPNTCACPCQPDNAPSDAASASSPCTFMRPPAPPASSDWMLQRPAANCSRACALSTGTRPLSQGPASRLVRSSCACQPLPWGNTWALPFSSVWGASGHKTARFSARNLAWADSTGCAAHGLIFAVTSADIGSGAPPFVGCSCADKESNAPLPASVPRNEPAPSSVMLRCCPTGACSVPCSCRSSVIGARASNTACPR